MKRRINIWLPPKGCDFYFCAESDDEFKAKHPIGYWFLAMLGIIALIVPICIYIACSVMLGADSHWMLLGFAGAFIVGIGFFNFVAIIIDQYLGHLVSIVSFIIGSLLIWFSLFLMGIV